MLHQAVHVVTTDLKELMDPYLHTFQSSSPNEKVRQSHIAAMELTLYRNWIAPVTSLEIMMRYVHVSLSRIQPENLDSYV
jgi:hypothetical protein